MKSIIKKDEGYKKRRCSLTGEELFHLFQRRYELIEGILSPLRIKLGEDIEIVDIGFAKGMQEEKKIFVRYREDDKPKLFEISNTDGEITVSANNEMLERRGFVIANKKMIQDVFQQMEIDGEEVNSEVNINSASKRFTASDNVRSFILRDSTKTFYIESSHPGYVNNGS